MIVHNVWSFDELGPLCFCVSSVDLHSAARDLADYKREFGPFRSEIIFRNVGVMNPHDYWHQFHCSLE